MSHAGVSLDPNLVGAIQAITGGGAQYSFDTTGVPSVMRAALACLRSVAATGYSPPKKTRSGDVGIACERNAEKSFASSGSMVMT